METEEELRATAGEAMAKLRAIEEARTVEKSKALVGKCFKFQNSYGVGHDGGPWWLYLDVREIDEHGCLYALHFQAATDGRFEVEPRRFVHHKSLDGSRDYLEITREEFEREWAAFKSRIAEI